MGDSPAVLKGAISSLLDCLLSFFPPLHRIMSYYPVWQGVCGYLTCTYLDLNCPGQASLPPWPASQRTLTTWGNSSTKAHDGSSRQFSRAHLSDLLSSFISFEHQNVTLSYVTCDFKGNLLCACVSSTSADISVRGKISRVSYTGFIFWMTT